MPDLTNAQIAAALTELGDLYELDGAVSYRVIAYRNAAKAIRDAPVSVATLVREGRATTVKGIGDTLATKLDALVTTGDIPQAVALRERFPSGLIAVTHLPGLGPKRARRLHDELGVDSLEALRTACERHQVSALKGFGAKVETQLLAALEAGHDGTPEPRVLLSRAEGIAEQLLGALRAHPAAERVEIAGSLRRQADTVKDLDLVATATDAAALVAAFAEFPLVETVHQRGEAGARVCTHTGMKVDLRVVEPDQFGNVLQHLTGSKHHNVQLREAAVRHGLHVSEYGILDDATGETRRCATEDDVYAALGLAWIPPELREGRGELQAAALEGGSGLPELITVDDLCGDLHMHTTASDGRASIEDMARAALARGYGYLCITDHSATHGFGDHVTPDALRRQIERVREVDAAIDGIRVLIGTETNILPGGEPDYDDELLAELDWAIASVHTSFRMERGDMTRRMVTAIEHPWVDAIAHPTGRKIETREPYAVDVEALIDAAARTGTMLEINSAPDRRDLNEIHARAAAQAGVRILISSDAHGPETLANVRYGIATARRAWLRAEDVANTRPWPEFAALRKRHRANGATHPETSAGPA